MCKKGPQILWHNRQWGVSHKYFVTCSHCCGSALVSVRIGIRHFLSMRIRIRIRIQSFDDQKFEKIYHRNFFLFFWSKIATYPWGSIKDVQATEEVIIPQKRTSSTSTLYFWPSWIWIRIQPTKMNANPDPQLLLTLPWETGSMRCLEYTGGLDTSARDTNPWTKHPCINREQTRGE